MKTSIRKVSSRDYGEYEYKIEFNEQFEFSRLKKISCYDKDDAIYISSAINNHDALVEALDLMRDEFKKITDMGDNKYYVDMTVLEQAEDLLESLK